MGGIARRIVGGIVTLWAVVTITFFLVHCLPGDPFASERGASEEVRRAQAEKYGYGKPLLHQYGIFISDVASGNFFATYRSHKSKNWTIGEIVGGAFPVSGFLGFLALSLATFIGIWAGAFAAARRASVVDRWTMALVVVGICLPSFIIAPILVLFFAILLFVFPPAGWEGVSSLILPSVVLALPYIAYISRLTRAGVLEALQKDYIRTARAKGVEERRVVLEHALRNSVIPVVSFLGPAAAGILTGSFVVEQIFSIPGMGKHFVNAVLNMDVYLVIGTVAVYSALLIVFNALVDVSYSLIDPRIRTSS